MSCDMKTLYAGAEGMFPQMKGQLTILNKKSPRLSYSLVNSFSLPSISKYMTRYETDFTVSVVSFTSSSLWVDAMYQIPETMIV